MDMVSRVQNNQSKTYYDVEAPACRRNQYRARAIFNCIGDVSVSSELIF